MTWTAFSFLFTGVLLNAAAQLLLKAGTNVLGVITLTRENWLDQAARMSMQPYNSRSKNLPPIDFQRQRRSPHRFEMEAHRRTARIVYRRMRLRAHAQFQDA